MPRIHQRRYVPCPWSEVQPSDLVPQGDPETVMVYRHEEHIGMVIRGSAVDILGKLAIRCERHASTIIPLSMAIEDIPIMIDTQANTQSNPRRIKYGQVPSNGDEA